MAKQNVERRLAAILAADVAGYSRLMGADEVGTLRALKAHRKELYDPVIAEHHGRIVKTTGDGVLVEFPSVVDAVASAVAIQRGMIARNAAIPQDRRIELRIGINVGDIIVDADDIYGDGVNVAARLEALAEPGGLCISGSAHDQVRDKLPFAFADRGEQSVKNISRPVRVHALGLDAMTTLSATPASADGAGSSPTPKRGLHGIWQAVAGVATVVVLAAGVWLAVRPVQAPQMSATAPRLSIVVLPFRNLGGDPQQDYLADVLTEELTTRVSRLPGSFIVSRTTAFTYLGKTIDVKQIGKDLGVRYALEGGAQKSGSRVRVTAQLIDTATGAHLWADQFDADRADMLQMQDEIVTRLGRSLQIELADIEASRLIRARAGNLDADDLAMQCEAAWLRFTSSRPEGQEGLKSCERALQIDNRNVRALEILAIRTSWEIGNNLSADPAAARRRVEELLSRASAIDPNSYLAHFAKAAPILTTRPEESLVEMERALALNPSFAPAYAWTAVAHWAAGRPEKAIEVGDRALRLFPQDPNAWAVLCTKAIGFFNLSRYEDANDFSRRTIAANPKYSVGYQVLAASLALSGHEEEAKETLKQYLSLPGNNPRTIAQFKTQNGYANLPSLKDHFARWYEGLRLAGMPEE